MPDDATHRNGSLLESRVRVPNNVVFRSFPSETVLLNLDLGKYHGLNPTAGRMLHELDDQPSVAAAAAAIAAEFGLPEDAAERDGCDLCEKARLGIEILVAYVRARCELRRAPIEDVVERLRCSAAADRGDDRAVLEEAVRLGRAVVRTFAFVPGDTRCLNRSLVLTRLLSRRGISARLVIAARTDPDFLAHAWVEHSGVPVLAPADHSFGRLVEL
jgi:hypothetical protein